MYLVVFFTFGGYVFSTLRTMISSGSDHPHIKSMNVCIHTYIGVDDYFEDVKYNWNLEN